MLVVLDDDPTGGQAVHGLRELLHWDKGLLEAQLADRRNAFFTLTNTRSMSQPMPRPASIIWPTS